MFKYSHFRALLAHYGKFIKFCLVGATGTIIDVGVLFLLVEYGHWLPLPACTVSFLLAVINNFILNKIWTFHDKSAALAGQFFKFLITSSIGLLFTLILMWLLLRWGVWYLLAKVIVIGIIVFWNYFINKLWTFRGNRA